MPNDSRGTTPWITPAGREQMEIAFEHAERVEPEWGDLAFEALCGYAEVADSPFTIEEMRLATGVQSPTDERAWGSVVQRAVRGQIIKRVGYAPATSSHGSPKPTWLRL